MKLSDFGNQVSRLIYDRGVDYLRRGRVKLVGSNSGRYYFTVNGTIDYCVEIQLIGDKVDYWYCDCPYDGGICKHVVACLLYLNNLLSNLSDDSSPVAKDSVISDDIGSLPSSEQEYLCFLAYSNPIYDLYELKRAGICKDLTVTARQALDKRLCKAGLMEEVTIADTTWRSHKEFRLSSKRWIDVLKFLLTSRRELKKKFDNFGNREPENIIMSLIAESLYCGEDASELMLSSPVKNLPNRFRTALWSVFETVGGDKLAPILPPWLINTLVLPVISSAVYQGDINSLNSVKTLLCALPDISKDNVFAYSLLRRFLFLYKGELLPEIEGEQAYLAFWCIKAVQLLYSGDVDGAIESFRKSLEIQKKQKVSTNNEYPEDPVCAFLYLCALSVRATEEDIHTLRTLDYHISRSNDNIFESFHSFILTVLGEDLTSSRSLLSTMSWSRYPIEKLITSLVSVYAYGDLLKGICSYSGTRYSEYILNNLKDAECMVLEGELAAIGPEYGVVGRWPYDPVLPRIRRRERWESELDKLISLVAKDDNSPLGERIFYYCTPGSDRVEIRLQRTLKSGGQSRGKQISASRYHDGDYPLDDIDIAIKGSWSHSSWETNPTLEDVIPFCVGTDKLQTDSDIRKLVVVAVTEEKPYITTVRKDGRISFLSNIPPKALESFRDNLVFEWGKDKKSIKFWRLDKSIAAVMRGLLAMKSVPEQAEPMLEKLICPIAGKLEFQSDIKGGVKLERIQGSARLCVRILPSSQNFSVTVLAHPLEGGTAYFEPGKGSVLCVDGNESGRYEVERNLRKEKKNLEKVLDVLDCSGSQDAFAIDYQILRFLDSMPSLEEVCYIEWPQGKSLRLIKPAASSFNISAVGKGGWFELDGDLKVSEDTVLSVAALLELTRGSERYVKISDDQYMMLSEELRRQLGRLDAVSQRNRGKLAVPELAMSVISDSVGDIVDIENGEKLAERRKRVIEASSLDIPLPDGLNAILRPYQEDGFRWMMRLSHWGAGACLADDMGLGKTVQSIAFLLAKAADGPQLVVAPASVIGNWVTEIHRFAPSLRVVVLNDMAAGERAEAMSEASKKTIVISTYGILASGRDELPDVKWITAILDEAHTIKNRDTKMSAAVMKLSAVNRIILTGTPIQNHLGELWNLFHFINPGLFGSFDHFQQCFVASDTAVSRDALKRLVAPFMLRRTKNEVVRELPDKTEVFLPVELSDQETAVYEVIRREAKAELSESSIVSVNALAMMTKLRMAACSISLVEKSQSSPSSKLEVFVEKLSSIVDGGNSVLVFSQFTSFLELAVARLKEAGIKEFMYLDGSTPIAKRQKMVESFQNGDCPIFLISLKAGGLGLNLTGANYVIHLDPWWNPAIEQQATDRAYRIGQQQNVTVYHLIAKNTIEEKIIRLHDTKRQLADSILDGTSSSHKLTAEEILDLIS